MGTSKEDIHQIKGPRDPIKDDLYRDTRSDELKRVIYGDDQVTLIRESTMDRTGKKHIHAILSTKDFKNKQEHGRLEFKPDAESDIPKADQIKEDETKEEKSKKVKKKISNASSKSKEGGNDEDNENTTSPENPPEDGDTITAYVEDNGDNDQTSEPTSTEDKLDDDPAGWTAVSGVGDNTALEMYKAGYDSLEKVRDTSIEELTKVNNVGKGTAKNFKEHATKSQQKSDSTNQRKDNTEEEEESTDAVKWNNVDGIGKKMDQRLHNNGFNTISDMKNADKESLESIDNLGPKGIEQLRDYANKES